MKLKKSTLFYYSLAEMPINIALFPILVFIPKFYTGEMGVPLALAANIILAVRIFDVFTDPVVGYINDRTNTKWGRRRPWIAIATPLLMVSIYMLFIPPEGAGALHLFLWMFLLSIGTTMLIIPYYAWGAELSPDYNERSRITGWRSISGVVGSLSAQLIPTIALVFFGLGGSTNVLYIVGIASVIIMPICVFFTVLKVPESKDYVQSNISPIKGFKIMLENSPFKRLIMAFMFGGIAFSITIPLYLFFITLRDFFIKKYKNLAQNIAHFGFSLLILSILFNNLFSSEIITNLKVGETYNSSKTKIVFESINQKKQKNYNSIIANFSITNSEGINNNLSPELRIYNQPKITTSEADIKTTLMKDKFIVINLVQNQDYFNVRYQVKPFMLWIWLSVMIISLGGLISLLKKRT